MSTPLPSEPHGGRSAALAAGQASAASRSKARSRTRIIEPPKPLEPIHRLRADGEPDPECIRGGRERPCAHHPTKEDRTPKPQVCGLQRCETSSDANGRERLRDAWNGTAERNPRGLRHFGDVALGGFVFTLPEALRGRAVGDRLRRFRKEADEMGFEVLRRHAGTEHALFWGKSWLHPEGDEEPGVYKPHENLLVPMRFYLPGAPRGFNLNRLLPKSWLGRDGWVQERWRARLVSVFGQWWEGEPPVLDWFFEYRSTPEEKTHALTYFGRTFPAWSGHAKVPMRPRSLGLAHWKHRQDLLACLGGELAPLLPFGQCKPCAAEGEEVDARVDAFGATKEDAEAAVSMAIERHSCAACQREPHEIAAPYVQHRRIMGGLKLLPTAASPPTGPPRAPLDVPMGPIPDHVLYAAARFVEQRRRGAPC